MMLVMDMTMIVMIMTTTMMAMMMMMIIIIISSSSSITMASIDQVGYVSSWLYIPVVLSIVAVSIVAVETDVAETVSVAKLHLCVVSGLLELLRSFLRAFFSTSV